MAPRNLPLLEPGSRGLEWRNVAYNPPVQLPGGYSMKYAFAPATALLCSLCVPSTSFGQAKPAQAPATKAAATTSAPAPAAPARFVRPIKGTASVQVIKGAP